MADETPIVKVTSPLMDWITHPLSMAVVGLSVACLVFIGYGLYRGYVKKPEPTQTQNIGKTDTVINDNRAIHQTFGCSTLQGVQRK